MSIISGITCKNGTALELTAPVSSGDTSIVNIYNTGNYTAKLDGNLTLGNGINSGNFSALNATINGTTVINGTSYIYDHNLVVQGGGIVIQPSLTPQAASGLYIQTPAGTNQAYIDATTGTIGCKGVYVQNSAGTALGYIDSFGSIYTTSAGGGGGLYVRTSDNTENLARIDAFGNIFTTTGLFVQDSVGPSSRIIASINNAGYLSADSAFIAEGIIINSGGATIYNDTTINNGSLALKGTTTGLYIQNPAGTTMASIDNAGNLNAVAANVGSLSATGNISTNGHINNGLYNLAPIAYGLITNPSTLSKSYNVNSTPTTSNNSDITITITNPSLNGNYIPIITFTGLGYNQVVPIIEVNSTTSNTITFTSYQLRNSNNNQIITDGLPVNTWSFYFVVYGN